MSFFHFDVYSDFFTPQEFPVEILNVAKEHDVIACCLPSQAKNFLAFMLFKEFYYKSNGISVYIHEGVYKNDEPDVESKALTKSSSLHEKKRKGSKETNRGQSFPFDVLSSVPSKFIWTANDFKENPLIPSVAICSRKTFMDLTFKDSKLFDTTFADHINLVVIPNIHEALTYASVRKDLRKILDRIRSLNSERPPGKQIRLVFLGISLLHFYGNEANGFWRMEETFRKLEKFCGARVDTASDIVALLRYSSLPTERIVLVGPRLHSDISIKLILEVKKIIEDFKRFLNSHNYNPAKSLGYTLNEFEELCKEKAPNELDELDEEDEDSLAEELRQIPHPRTAPMEVLREFETILDKMGPWCANRAIFLLNNKVVGMKIQVPYVRHYLLLGALHTRLVWIQGIFNEAFDETEPLDVLETFSTPKLVAVLNILRRFDLSKPHESRTQASTEVQDKNDEDSESEFTVADYLEQQKQAETQQAAMRGGRYHGRRKHTRRHDPEAKKLPEAQTSSTTSKEEPHNAKEPNPVKPPRHPRRARTGNKNETNLCGLLICEDRFSARLLYHFLVEAADADPNLIGLSPTLAVPSNPEYDKESREAEIEYKRREESLRHFRYREANFLIGTSLLEDGIELPKANIVIRFDESPSFRSHLFSKGRAQGFDAEYYIFTDDRDKGKCLRQLSAYKIVEEMLMSHTLIGRPLTDPSLPIDVEIEWMKSIPQFKTSSLSNSISIINRYCARLPSDSFTRLTPVWTLFPSELENGSKQYRCTLRLPINSPVKWPITGLWAPTQKLAMRVVALQSVIILHRNGELDDSLVPVGKEGVIQEPDLYIGIELADEEFGEFRPGSTRRRQYYDKQLSPELLHCLPTSEKPVFLYWLRMVLTSPLPDDQNTRGRKLYPPEMASQAFGILLSKEIPPIPRFPIYTRCGEVHVELVSVKGDKSLDELTPENLKKLSAFHHYTFTSVLRLDKYLTLFDPEAAENSYFVVPLTAVEKASPDDIIHNVQLDWEFVNRIWTEGAIHEKANEVDRVTYEFKADAYLDAVVTPWYRNNDQPQFFYVAEICTNLTPRSQFPGCEFKTFEEYYQRKYNLSINNSEQPLLDVDHTSARLNFLTPRYVNRKGMALPTSSEATKRAKRENLEQKQILIPELCAVHPFSGSLWRQAVCLPCVLYRVNALLLANSVRSLVATQLHGLGVLRVPTDFKWETMSFGWSIQDVFGISDVKTEQPAAKNTKKSGRGKGFRKKTSKKVGGDIAANGETSTAVNEESSDGEASKEGGEGKSAKPEADLKEVEEVLIPKLIWGSQPPETQVEDEQELSGFEKAAREEKPAAVTLAESFLLNDNKHAGKSANEILTEEMKNCRQPELEIGVWSNEMATGEVYSEPDYDDEEDELFDPTVALPSNLMMLDKNWTWGGRSKLFNHRVHRALYGSPTHWGEVWDRSAFEPPEDLENQKRGTGSGHDDDNASVNSDLSGSDESYLDGDNNLKIQFEGNTAEAMDKRKFGRGFDLGPIDDWSTTEDLWWPMDEVDEEEEDLPEVEDDMKMSYETDQRLRVEFDARVEKKLKGIHDIVAWNEISKLQPRGRRPIVVTEDSNDEDEKLLVKFIQKLSLKSPPEVPGDNAGPSFQTVSRPTFVVDPDEMDPNVFNFDYNPPLHSHCGPSPCQVLQALTMSNANDGHNLERLETIGDSFLKYAITSYLFCTYESIHEGKLSHLRSKQVSNVHLYRLGRRRGLGELMVSAKFEPHDNWLPPCYHIPKGLDKALIRSQVAHGTGNFSMAQVNALKGLTTTEIEHALTHNILKADAEFIPYNLVTQQSVPDKSIADCVEALIGAYLTSAGPKGALLFMSWLGIRVLPSKVIPNKLVPEDTEYSFYMPIPNTEEVVLFTSLKPPTSPLLRYTNTYEAELVTLLKGYERFEDYIGYKFRDKSYLLQAFSHASYTTNTLTDCYQRLEFLGDAILDYLITRHLYEDKRQHSPGSLTDLRSALVNNTIFASLSVKNGFHLYFRHSSPGLTYVLQKFVTFQEQHSHTLTQDYYLMGEEECDEAEDIEVPKALGDVFESVAGAIFLDSGMSLGAVWKVYYKMMKDEIEQFSENVPKSPIRELLELEPETAKFGKPEKLWDGRRVRVSVEVIGVGVFRGIGRNYRIAKCTAAKCALRHLRRLRQPFARSGLPRS